MFVVRCRLSRNYYNLTHVNPQKLVLWCIWLGFIGAVICYGIFLRQENPVEMEIDAMVLVGFLIPLLGSLATRFFFLAKHRDPRQVMIYFLAGIAQAEILALIGLFVFPYFQDSGIALAILALLAFYPAFISLEEQTDQQRQGGDL